jgi:cyanophycin synthetase
MNPKNRLVHQHIQAGGLAAVLEEGINGHMITLYDEGLHLPLLWTYLIPATLEGKALHNVQNAMVAALVSYAMGIKVENIRQGLRTFDTSYFQVPGRMNIFDEHPFKVILDYGHNPAAIQCMVDLVGRLDVEGRRLCVLSAPGDRRDADVVEIARIAAAGNFDHIILRRDDHPRGREEREIPQLLRKSLLENGYSDEDITTIIDEQDAVAALLAMGERGDLLLVFGDAISRCWKQIITHRPGDAPSSRPRLVEADRIPLDGPPTPAGLTPAEFEALIIDERGVRLARASTD